MRRLLIGLLLAATAAVGLVVVPDTALAPRPAQATWNNLCNPNLVEVANHSSGVNYYQLFVRLCVNQADDAQSLRAYAGWECRFNAVRHNQCRVSMPHLKLWMDGVTKRDNNKGTYPAAPNFAGGWSGYGDWYNYPGLCWPMESNWTAVQEGWQVRWDDGALSNVTWSGSQGGPIGCVG